MRFWNPHVHRGSHQLKDIRQAAVLPNPKKLENARTWQASASCIAHPRARCSDGPGLPLARTEMIIDQIRPLMALGHFISDFSGLRAWYQGLIHQGTSKQFGELQRITTDKINQPARLELTASWLNLIRV